MRGGPGAEDLDLQVRERDKRAQGGPGARPPWEYPLRLRPLVLGCRCLKECHVTVGKHDGQSQGG